jgi:hypothetical protein
MRWQPIRLRDERTPGALLRHQHCHDSFPVHPKLWPNSLVSSAGPESSQDKRSIAGRAAPLTAVDLPSWPHVGGALLEVIMEYSDYLRDQAVEYRRRAESNDDPIEKGDLFESAAIYEMVADDLDHRRPGDPAPFWLSSDRCDRYDRLLQSVRTRRAATDISTETCAA